jgi:uncharacterized membrane protein YhaH (DUF805 family)
MKALWFAVVAFWTQYGDFSSHTPRGRFWWTILFLGASSWIISVLDLTLMPALGLGPDIFGGAPLLTTFYAFLTVTPSLALFWRRLNDIYQSGWWALAPAILGLFAYLNLTGILDYSWSPILGLLALVLALFSAVLLLVFTLLPSGARTQQTRNAILIGLAISAAIAFLAYVSTSTEQVELPSLDSADSNGLPDPSASGLDTCDQMVTLVEQQSGRESPYDPPFEDDGKWAFSGIPEDGRGIGNSLVCVHGFVPSETFRVIRVQRALPDVWPEYEQVLLQQGFSPIAVAGHDGLHREQRDELSGWLSWELYVPADAGWLYIKSSEEGSLLSDDPYVFLVEYVS